MAENKDFVDNTFDKIASVYAHLTTQGFAAQWFKWIEWVTLTAALWVVGKKSGSIMVKAIALFSAGLVFFTAWFSMERFADAVLPNPNKLPKLIVWLLTFAVALIPIIVMQFIGEVINSVLQ